MKRAIVICVVLLAGCKSAPHDAKGTVIIAGICCLDPVRPPLRYTAPQTTFHNCSWHGGSGNNPHLFDTSTIYKCDEGTVEIAGRITMIIENGYLYEDEMGVPNEYASPRPVTPADYRDYKWCPKPSAVDPNSKEMCGDKPTTCWDGKLATWDSAWKGYSCSTPDHKQ